MCELTVNMAHLLVSPAFKVFASCPQFSCQCQKDKRWIEPTAKPFLLLPETHLIVARRIQNGTFCWKLFMQLATPSVEALLVLFSFLFVMY